ncbi:MAG: hypothetical protein IPK55_15240 [Streptococcus sp.]|nr:hypothetical protein [Streptococcus sp.]
MKDAFVLGEDIDEGIYDIARTHLQKLNMIDETVKKYIKEESKLSDEVTQVPDAVNVLYEMERAVWRRI